MNRILPFAKNLAITAGALTTTFFAQQAANFACRLAQQHLGIREETAFAPAPLLRDAQIMFTLFGVGTSARLNWQTTARAVTAATLFLSAYGAANYYTADSNRVAHSILEVALPALKLAWVGFTGALAGKAILYLQERPRPEDPPEGRLPTLKEKALPFTCLAIGGARALITLFEAALYPREFPNFPLPLLSIMTGLANAILIDHFEAIEPQDVRQQGAIV